MGLFNKSVPLEKQLAKLAEIGVRADADLDESELFTNSTREQMETTPYKLLAEALSYVREDDYELTSANCLLMMDFECIEDTDDYARVIRRFERLTGGALEARNIQDEVEIDDEVMWVSFESRLGPIRWEPRIQDDWFDAQVLVDYDALLARVEDDLRLYFNPTDYGQAAFIAAFTPVQARQFTKLTKIPLVSVR